MDKKRNVQALLLTSLTLAIILFGLASMGGFVIRSSATLTITATTDKQTYLLRQKATITGNVTLGGSPATDLVVAEQVENPSPYGHYSFRTLQIGNPAGPWLVNITNIYIRDQSGNPIDTIKAGSQMQVGMSVYNTQSTGITIYATITVYDANMASIGANTWGATMDPLGTSSPNFFIGVPNGAVSGPALIIACVYSSEPKSGAIVYCPETAYYYCISRTQTGLFGIQQFAPPPPQTTPGVYDASIRLPTNPRPGKYSVYVLGQSSPTTISSATTNFTVQSTSGIPPQASFAYYPPNPSINHPVSFDASSSTPEGYNDIITRYEWDFGDGTPHYVSTGSPANPTATHTYTSAIQYVVTLNVTNNEGLWCTTSKPITIGLGYGPTARFTWSPHSPVINDSIAFDASNSTPGDYSTLASYAWNFSDGTGIFNVTTPQTTHSFSQPLNYTVTLTVTDSVGRTNTTSATVQVYNSTGHPWDVNGDGKVDVTDIFLVAKAFGSTPRSSNWDPRCDVNGDGKVDISDVFLVAKHYGEVYT
jgi:PKD repeat protein